MGRSDDGREDEEMRLGAAGVGREMEFLEWTDADHLRHSKFVGLREDKDASQVVKEKV